VYIKNQNQKALKAQLAERLIENQKVVGSIPT
jgi:hypothetical protein